MADERLKVLREEIDRLDAELLRLLNVRAQKALEIGEIKKREGLPLYIPHREREVLEGLVRANPGPFPSGALEVIFREVISACLSLQRPVRVAYLGPEATHTHQAALEYFGASVEFLPVRFVEGIFQAVERGQAHYGVVPFENSTEGVVSSTVDMFFSSPAKIVGETYLRVSHHLLCLSGDRRDVKRVYSHPHATAQCKKWLSLHLPGVPVVDVPSTAEAAARAAQDPDAGAIASETAAILYGLKVAQAGIEDVRENYTRFLVLGREEMEPTGRDKTSLLFSVPHEVGALCRILHVFAQRGINLTKIESRPSKEKAWDYLFYVDFEGHAGEDKVKQALEDLKGMALTLKVLGSYPRYRKEGDEHEKKA